MAVLRIQNSKISSPCDHWLLLSKGIGSLTSGLYIPLATILRGNQRNLGVSSLSLYKLVLPPQG